MMTEADYYNALSRSGLNKDAVKLLVQTSMAQHLYREHDMGIREIAKTLELKQNVVHAMIMDSDE